MRLKYSRVSREILWFAGAANLAGLAALASQEERGARDTAFVLHLDSQGIQRQLLQASDAPAAAGSSFILVSSPFAFFFASHLSLSVNGQLKAKTAH